MIDIHCHILPKVDDGPKSLDESKKMIDMAYEDGIRGIVLTPHFNHPIDFKASLAVEEAYGLVKAYVEEKYGDLSLYLGAEVYIEKDYHRSIERIEDIHRINNSSYVLMEFPRDIKKEVIIEIIHEAKIRGIRPVIAHIEMYEDIVKNIDCMEKIKLEGALIQVTASSLMGKQGLKIRDFIRKAISKGYVDVIASDAHGDRKRRPRLGEAYEYVNKNYSQEVADKLFIKNPSLLIGDLEIPKFKIRASKSKAKTTILVASLTLSLFILLAFTRNMGNNISYSDKGEENIKEEETSRLEVIEGSSEKNLDDTFTLKEVEDLPPMEEDCEGEVEVISQYDKIVDKYYSRLNKLQEEYTSQVEGIVAKIIDAKENIEDEEERNREINKYIDKLMNMEELLDINVYEELYNMQNDLEEFRFEVYKVNEYRQTYHSKKAELKEYYINSIRN